MNSMCAYLVLLCAIGVSVISIAAQNCVCILGYDENILLDYTRDSTAKTLLTTGQCYPYYPDYKILPLLRIKTKSGYGFVMKTSNISLETCKNITETRHVRKRTVGRIITYCKICLCHKKVCQHKKVCYILLHVLHERCGGNNGQGHGFSGHNSHPSNMGHSGNGGHVGHGGHHPNQRPTHHHKIVHTTSSAKTSNKATANVKLTFTFPPLPTKPTRMTAG